LGSAFFLLKKKKGKLPKKENLLSFFLQRAFSLLKKKPSGAAEI